MEQNGTSWLPPRGVRWLMRVLAMAALGVAMYLSFVHLAANWAAARASVPLCGGLSWLDCMSVLNSRWATWLGVPTAAIGAVVYAVVLVGLFSYGRRWRDVLIVAAVMMIGAGVWFIYVQAAVLERWCSYCLMEHAIGGMLALLMLPYVISSWKSIGWVVVGVLLVGVLIGGQTLIEPQYIQRVQWSTEEAGKWVDEGGSVELLDGSVMLNPGSHPVLGLPMAERFVVEVIDFTCKRCAAFAEVLNGAREKLGPEVAVIVVFWPVNSDCNPSILNTPEEHKDACELAKLAASVWLAKPGEYEVFHDWLISEQETMSVARARERAAQLISSNLLNAMLHDNRVDQLLRRDMELTQAMKLNHLPGLIVGDARFTGLPVEAGVLAEAIRQAWAQDEQ